MSVQQAILLVYCLVYCLWRPRDNKQEPWQHSSRTPVDLVRLCHGAHVLPSASGSAMGLTFCHWAHVLPSASGSAIGLMFCHQAAHVLPSGSSCSAIRQLMFCHQAAHVLPSGGSCSATFSLVGVMYCTNTTFSGFSIQVLNYYFLLFFILFYSKIHFGSEKKFNNFMKFFLGQ
jgi:hypothetical protein